MIVTGLNFLSVVFLNDIGGVPLVVLIIEENVLQELILCSSKKKNYPGLEKLTAVFILIWTDLETSHCHLFLPCGSRNRISLFGQFVFLVSVFYTT